MKTELVYQDDKIQIFIASLPTNEENISLLNPDDLTAYKKISSQSRKMEFLGVRLLLHHAGIQGKISYQNKKPILSGDLNLSISHNKTHVAVGLSKIACGIDIEHIGARVLRIQSRFLTDFEMQLAGSDLVRNSLMWSAKEAAYKLDNSLIDFKQDMEILELDEDKQIVKMRCSQNERILHFRIFNDNVICWITA